MTSSSVHFPQCLQNFSSTFKSRRASETYSPHPFSGITPRNPRIMPPTPIFRQCFRPASGCNDIQTTNLGAILSNMAQHPRSLYGIMHLNRTVRQYNHHYLLNVTFRSTSTHVPPRNTITSLFAAASRQSARVVSLAEDRARRSRSSADGRTSSWLLRAKLSSGPAVWRLDSSLRRWA